MVFATVNVRENLTGRIFGRLTVLQQTEDYVDPKGIHYARWLCKCACKEHNIIEVVGSKLKNGHTSSCGCLQKERASESNKHENEYSLKHIDKYGEYYIGITSNTGNKFYVDADDYNVVKEYCWYEHVNALSGYSSLETVDPHSNKHVSMHYLLGFKYCDHKDRNPLNNRKCNLRRATHAENVQIAVHPKTIRLV